MNETGEGDHIVSRTDLSVDVLSAPGIDITAVTKLKHADLWAAAKSMGSQAALARHLDVDQGELGKWINLKSVPPAEPLSGTRWTEDYINNLEAKLVVLTGKSWEELFPQVLRNNAEFLECEKTIEAHRHIEAYALSQYALRTHERVSRPLLVDGEDPSEQLRSQIRRSLECLAEREWAVITLRYGLEDGECHTYAAIGHVLGRTRSRVQMIEYRALRKLREHFEALTMADDDPIKAKAWRRLEKLA